MPRLNWSAVGALAVSLLAWTMVAEAGYRLTHHGQGGLRHALYAHAVNLAHQLEREV